MIEFTRELTRTEKDLVQKNMIEVNNHFKNKYPNEVSNLLNRWSDCVPFFYTIDADKFKLYSKLAGENATKEKIDALDKHLIEYLCAKFPNLINKDVIITHGSTFNGDKEIEIYGDRGRKVSSLYGIIREIC